MSEYTVDGQDGRYRIRRNGVPMRRNREFPGCYCCNPRGAT